MSTHNGSIPFRISEQLENAFSLEGQGDGQSLRIEYSGAYHTLKVSRHWPRRAMRWAIITGMYNAADLATEFCTYYLGLGVDRIFIAEYGSTDGTLDLLQPFVRAGQVEIVPIPTHHFATYDPSNAILATIREEAAADWVSFLDPDEFLTGPENLKEMLAQEWSCGVEAIAVPRANLTGIGPISPQAHYLTHLTLKIVKTEVRISSASATLSSPWIFSRIPPKVMVRTQSSLTISTGEHHVLGAVQGPIRSSSLEILHLPMRSYESFQEKIERGREYFAKNPELAPNTGWHWRRWIELFQSGRLREDYEKQFPGPEVAEILLAEGRVVPETRLADWWAHDQ
jgi:Glycosyl transferase family 2